MEIVANSCLNVWVPPSDPANQTEVHDEDADLMLQAREGDMDAFEMLVSRYSKMVIGTIAKMLGDWTEAEDLAQQVFVRAWKARGSYRPQARFKTWLMTITRNAVFNEVRRRRRHPATSLEEPSMQFALEDHGSASTSPDRMALERELVEAIDRALLELPENQRLAMVLLRHGDMPYEEIAATMNLRVGAVKSLIFRARQELRLRLGKFLHG